MKKQVLIVGGGTLYPIKNHLALTAPAYGSTALRLTKLCKDFFPKMETQTVLTKMADPNSEIETYEQLKHFTENSAKRRNLKIVFYNPAVVDFVPTVESARHLTRLKSTTPYTLQLTPLPKLINTYRSEKKAGRKDIFVVGFKQTYGLTEQAQYKAGLEMLKKNQINLVLANDTATKSNMIITPEEASYHITNNRSEALYNLIEMTKLRSQLTFTRSNVIAGEPVKWTSDLVPDALRKTVEWCIERGAYKPFGGVTVGHFACKIADDQFLTSMRKTNFNEIYDTGLVKIKTDGPDTVLAYGAKPSVGGQSQRIIFNDHENLDCVVHFHCELKKPWLRDIPIVSQRAFECGSHQCGQNTSENLAEIGWSSGGYPIKVVMLEKHGPNIVFSKHADPQHVIEIIDKYFDLNKKSGGFQID